MIGQVVKLLKIFSKIMLNKDFIQSTKQELSKVNSIDGIRSVNKKLIIELLKFDEKQLIKELIDQQQTEIE